MTLRTEIVASLRVTQTGAPDLGQTQAIVAASLLRTLASGTTSDKADLAFSDRRALSGSGADNLDLAGGLTDAFGATLTFATVKAILIVADADNAGDLVVGNGSNPFTGPFGGSAHTAAVRPGGCLMVVAPETGWTVTASSGDILKITNGAGSAASYDILIVGTSA